MVTTPAGQRSGIGDYVRCLLPYLREHLAIEIFVAPEHAGREEDGTPLRSAAQLDPRAFDRILYQLGNERGHAFMCALVARLGGTVAQHDWVLFDLAAAARPALARGGLRGHIEALREGGWGALGAYARSRREHPHDLAADRFALPLNRSIVRMADAFIVHNSWMRGRILDERNAWTPIGVVPHGAERAWREEDRRAVRDRLDLPPAWREGFLLVSFGAVQEHKRVGVLLEALARARAARGDVHLALVGSQACERFAFDERVRELGLGAALRCTGWVDDETAERWLQAADLAVNLRGPTTGGASGGLHRALSLGRGVVATADDPNRELPDGCVLRVAVGPGEIDELARLLVELRDDPARRAALEREARRYVDEVCHWSHVARRYAELLAAFPAQRSNRRSLIGAAVAEADERRRLPARLTDLG